MSSPVSESPARKCDAAAAALVLVDLQERLGAAMPAKVLNRVLMNARLLARSAALLEVPVTLTEQYPRGLGTTLAAVTEAVPEDAPRITKQTFSCCGTSAFTDALDRLERAQIVLAGMEAHVCVLQTALDLAATGREVFVVEDAICSRRLENYQNALDRLRQCGVQVVSAESVVFEWLGNADHARFREVQALLR